MTCPPRSELLAEASLEVLERLADRVLAGAEVRVHKLPASELAHMQFRDPVRGQPFFLGEVLFHECVVELNGAWGYGYALGQDPQRALFAAVLDAALNAGHPLSAEIEAALDGSAREAAQNAATEATLVERTRVRFEVLDG
jgi:alpha-D-ribose 1-methylphosphonate 5-triphosphate synthase subunit PhnG